MDVLGGGGVDGEERRRALEVRGVVLHCARLVAARWGVAALRRADGGWLSVGAGRWEWSKLIWLRLSLLLGDGLGLRYVEGNQTRKEGREGGR